MMLLVILKDENTYKDVLADQYRACKPDPLRLRGMQGHCSFFSGLAGSVGGLHDV
jgi:hypothetical protein